MTRVDFFYSFRSPYSYLSAPRAFALAERHGIEVAFHGVIPMAMRGQSVPLAKRLHTLRDARREADRLGLPFGRLHDPIGDGALRCLLVAQHARDEGRLTEFVLTAGQAIWAEATDVSRDAGLRAVCERAGLAWDGCAAALHDPELRRRVQSDTDAVAALGHWGVPLLVLNGEVYWGQDRVEDVERALLTARASGAAEPAAPAPPPAGSAQPSGRW